MEPPWQGKEMKIRNQWKVGDRIFDTDLEKHGVIVLVDEEYNYFRVVYDNGWHSWSPSDDLTVPNC
jgi:hypothetical protein